MTLWGGGAVAQGNEVELFADWGADGTVITADSTSHVKGAWAEIDASVGFDVMYFQVGGDDTHINNNDTGQLMDIGVGSEGNEKVLVANIPTGYSACGGRSPAGFPVFIPKGTRISARIQATIASDVLEVILYLRGGRSWMGETFQTVDTMGAKTSLSGGTSISSQAIVEIVASTPNEYKGLGLVFDLGQASSTGGGADRVVEVFVGATSSEKSLVANIDFRSDSSEEVAWVIPFHGFIPMRFNIPAGSRLSAQAIGSRGIGLVIFGYR